MRVIGGNTTKREVDLLFSVTSGEGDDLDPVVQILTRRVMGLRRANAKQSSILMKMKSILRCYNHLGAAATDIGNDELFGEPAPHPNTMNRKHWMDEVKPLGPIGYLLQSVNCIGGIVGANFDIEIGLETPVNLLTMPYQALAKTMSSTASRARTLAAARMRADRKNLKAIDVIATHSPSKKRSKEDRSYLNKIQSGGGWDKVSIKAKTGGISDTTCQYCGHGHMTLDHIVWWCPHFDPFRASHDSGIARLNPDTLPCHMRIGIAQAMMMDIGKSYWGATIDEINKQDSELLGLMDPGPKSAEGKTLLHERKDKKMNARQFMANERYGGNDTCMPAPPRKVEGCCPAHPSGYSDGGLANPSRQHFAVGGFGIFWPDAQNEQPPE